MSFENTIIQSKIEINRSCEACNYTTTIKRNFERHLLSKKHIDKINNNTKKYECSICNKQFNNRQSLHNHNKKCNNITSQKTDVTMSSFLEIIQRQSEMIEKQNELIEKLATQSSQPTIIHNHTNVTDMSHNTVQIKFSMDTYLNETCKEAISFEDSLPSRIEKDVILGFDEKKLTNRSLFINMVNGFWKHLPQTKKPIQAYDIRRNRYYLKTNNGWLNSRTNKEQIHLELNRLMKIGMLSKKEYENDENWYEVSNAIRVFCNLEELFELSISQLLKSNMIEKKLIKGYEEEE